MGAAWGFQDTKPPVIAARPLAGEGRQPLPHGLVAATLRPHGLRIDAEQPAGGARRGRAPP